MTFQLDKKQQVKEIIKCGKDPVYFLNNYARISHPLHGLILFNTYDFQDELLKDFNDSRLNVILKARQLGISTITAGYIVWLMLFHRSLLSIPLFRHEVTLHCYNHSFVKPTIILQHHTIPYHHK